MTYRLNSPSHTWVQRLTGATRMEFALAVSASAGAIPDNAYIELDGFRVGSWQPQGGTYHRVMQGRAGLCYSDSRDGQDWLWIADRSEAICVSK